MSIKNAYLNEVYQGLAKRNAEQKEFLQAVEEVLESLEPVVEAHPEYEKASLIERLHNIMVNIYKNAADAAERYGMKGNLVAGANIAGFEKIASAMMSQGVV